MIILLNIQGQVTRKCIFFSASMYRLTTALQQSLCRLPRFKPFQRNTEDVACSFVLLFSNKGTIRMSSRFYCQTMAIATCMTDFTTKMLHVIYFVIRCEAKLFKCDLKFSSALESSTYQEYNVKPIIFLRFLLDVCTYEATTTLVSHYEITVSTVCKMMCH